MKYCLTIRGSFEAAHRLLGYKGECSSWHGHSWKVEVTVKTHSLNELGLAVDFKELRELLKSVLSKYDHAVLCHPEDPMLPAFQKDKSQKVVVLPHNPTCEVIGTAIYGEIGGKLPQGVRLVAVTVEETEGSKATVSSIWEVDWK